MSHLLCLSVNACGRDCESLLRSLNRESRYPRQHYFNPEFPQEWWQPPTATLQSRGLLQCVAVCVYTATHCNTLQHTSKHCRAEDCREVTMQHNRYLTRCTPISSTHCDTLRHTATHCSTLQYTATQCNTMQHNPLSLHMQPARCREIMCIVSPRVQCHSISLYDVINMNIDF